jgi:murein DD-endopeptidase MepM/ murein hydrolase activator NlpD
MAKVSQNADTLVTLNRIPNPEAIGPGESLIIPNARGLFVDGDDATETAKRYGVSERVLIRCEGRWFIPGGRLSSSELALFRGSGFRYPLRFRRISSRFGTRIDPFTRRATFHGGIDLSAPVGTDVAASRGGVVVSAGVSGGYGQLVVIKHEHGYSTYYGHLSRIFVKPGQSIREGEPLGAVGSTGRSTGPHLHFEVRKNGFRRRPELIGYAK